MNNNLLGKLKRKPKWKLKEERDDLQMEQKLIRQRIKVLEEDLSKLKDDYIVALKGTDGGAIAVLENKIEITEKKIDKQSEALVNKTKEMQETVIDKLPLPKFLKKVIIPLFNCIFLFVF